MAGQIVTKSVRRYVFGRWNPNKDKCEYLNSRLIWEESIDRAKHFRIISPNIDMNSCKEHYMPAFVSKVFVKTTRHYWGGGGVTITPTKLNHWQKLEGIMQI